MDSTCFSLKKKSLDIHSRWYGVNYIAKIKHKRISCLSCKTPIHLSQPCNINQNPRANCYHGDKKAEEIRTNYSAIQLTRLLRLPNSIARSPPNLISRSTSSCLPLNSKPDQTSKAIKQPKFDYGYARVPERENAQFQKLSRGSTSDKCMLFLVLRVTLFRPRPKLF